MICCTYVFVVFTISAKVDFQISLSRRKLSFLTTTLFVCLSSQVNGNLRKICMRELEFPPIPLPVSVAAMRGGARSRCCKHLRTLHPANAWFRLPTRLRQTLYINVLHIVHPVSAWFSRNGSPVLIPGNQQLRTISCKNRQIFCIQLL